MKALVVFDSVFGNTAQIARAIAGELGAQAVQVDSARVEQLAGVDLLVVGSPTRQFAATPATMAWLNGLPADALKGMRVAAFDTRIDVKDLNFIFRLIVDKGGYAAKPIAGLLQAKGGQLAAQPQAFFVKDREGPLKDGEVQRATAWAAQLK